MFTGLVETTGTLISKKDTETGAIFTFSASFVDNDLKIGDSIAINGACQTIIDLNENKTEWSVYSSFKTLELTNFKDLQVGEEVNLERPLLPHSRMGGHFVQGHVDGVGTVIKKEFQDNQKTLVVQIQLPEELKKYVVIRGSIAIDGISLTVVNITDCILELVLIPETIQKTNAKYWIEKKKVNIEVDILARYFEKFIKQ